ncbi:MAG TPA: hypothetical protein VFR85_18350 [Anaeromyxobacteraceae bacterium]|nr:hypothetical protein [Anaeromyxobacteraceae bacterium]
MLAAALAALLATAPPPEVPPAAPEEPAAAPVPAGEPAARPAEAPPRTSRLVSLLSGASLGRGGAAWTFGVGWPLLFGGYAQGVGERDDLGGGLEVDWPASEFFLAGLWRREIGGGGGSHLALRARLGFYACFGATWLWSDNRSDLGVELSPGLAWSLDTASGVLSVGGDVPVAWTFKRGGGWIAGAKLGVSYETPLWSEFSVGARLGAGVRGAGGGAPGAGEDRFQVEVTVVGTWRPF